MSEVHSMKTSSGHLQFGSFTKQIGIAGTEEDLEYLLRKYSQLAIILENKGDTISQGFEAEIDLRGLLVKELGNEEKLGGKVEGVYEMSRR
mmetsp:Transcript_42181/g.30907  ORF Transcript_42181/g.30907 Transcript_42181/m.30907 type:complete len:91 (+) Transcript_42181:602-874(+)